jgi:hypothetical protein
MRLPVTQAVMLSVVLRLVCSLYLYISAWFSPPDVQFLVSYQSDISIGFRFLQATWANNAKYTFHHNHKPSLRN